MKHYTRKNALTTDGGVELTTPSQRAKQLGCKSLVQVARASGVSKETLANWFRIRPWVFDAVCMRVAGDNA